MTVPSTAKDILSELTTLDGAVKDALAVVDKGQKVDLGPVAGRIASVCDAAVALPSDQARPLLPVMEELIARLDALTARLNATYGDLPKLNAEPAPKAAASAYGRGSGEIR